MTSPILVAVFTVAYLAVTVWLCRGLKLSARNLAMGGLACALTLILGSIMIPLPTGASITCGSVVKRLRNGRPNSSSPRPRSNPAPKA